MKQVEEILAACRSLPPEQRARVYRDLSSSHAFWMSVLFDRILLMLFGICGAIIGGILTVASIRYCEGHGFRENPVVEFWCSPVIFLEYSANRFGLISHFFVGSFLYGAYSTLIGCLRRPRWLMALAIGLVVIMHVLLLQLSHLFLNWL